MDSRLRERQRHVRNTPPQHFAPPSLPAKLITKRSGVADADARICPGTQRPRRCGMPLAATPSAPPQFCNALAPIQNAMPRVAFHVHGTCSILRIAETQRKATWRAQAEARLDKTNRKDNRMLVANARRIDLEVAPFNMFASLLAGAAGLRAQAQANLSIRVVWRCGWALQVAKQLKHDAAAERVARQRFYCVGPVSQIFFAEHVVCLARSSHVGVELLFQHVAGAHAQTKR